MDDELRYANDTYRRRADGIWRYPWGDPVPGARDLTLADLLAIDVQFDLRHDDAEASDLVGAGLLTEESHDRVLVRARTGTRVRDARDLVVGMCAPELQVTTMLVVTDIAGLAGVSKATIDSYRYRGYLPAPQSVRGRTPLWSRPIAQRWLQSRPGCGWRSDIYGARPTPRDRQA